MGNELENFYTREQANEGQKFPLSLPSGEPTDHWLLLRGVDSDEFRIADAISKQKAFEASGIADPRERAEYVLEEKRRLLASLIAGWSFEGECTEQARIDFLRQAPQIADQIDRFSVKRALFFGKRLDSSLSSSKQSSA